MNDWIRYAYEYHKKFNAYFQEVPNANVPEEEQKHRNMLLDEEVKELKEGMENKDIENIAKEIADIFCVLLGTIIVYGLGEKFNEILAEVHRSNMSKTYVEGKGKGQKLEGYKEADIKSILKL